MPKQINTYTFGQELVRRFGLKGRFQPVLDEVIVPVISVGEARPKDIRVARGGILRAAAGAGNQNIIRLQNPGGSGVNVKLTGWNGVSGAPLTDNVEITLTKGVSGASGNGEWIDTALSGIPAGKIAGLALGSAVLGPPLYHLDVDFNVWRTPITLTPGWYISLRQDAQNNTLVVWFEWEETDITVTNAP